VGAILARSGEPITSFIYVEEGEVEVINPYTNAVCPSRSAQPNSWAKSRY
jgi:hypothetical protein